MELEGVGLHFVLFLFCVVDLFNSTLLGQEESLIGNLQFPAYNLQASIGDW